MYVYVYICPMIKEDFPVNQEHNKINGLIYCG